jgi:anti-sigma factor RsiW
MDSHDRGHRLLAAFLAGELNPADAPRWDEHLLACEQCWRAVREDRAGRQAAQLLR